MNQPLLNFDLHTHSLASDGKLTPQALVHTAADAGVNCLSLTDHDTTSGLEAAQSAATERGIHFLPGVEISVTWSRRTLHIVGLAIDPKSAPLATGLSQLQAVRLQRARIIAEKLEKLGVSAAYERAELAAQGGQITRTHFARLLIEDGKCSSMQQCFKRYLRHGKPAYAGAEWATLDDAIDWIHQSGGIAVLAHPMAYGMTAAWRNRMFAAFTQAGGKAAEVTCGAAKPADIALAAAHAVEHALLGSVGSDFHSPEQRWLKLGRALRLPTTVTPVWSHPSLQKLIQVPDEK